MKVNKLIDHTLLKPEATTDQVLVLCQEAKEYDFMSVCVNPHYVETCADALKGTDVAVCTVVGFPLGMNTTETKVFETKKAIDDGATEIDMVINVGALKEGNYDYVREEIRTLKEATGDLILKVIIETCLLNKDEIRIVSKLAVEAGADFVKTSTGFSTGGATVEDVRIMRETVGPNVGVKASGGVRSLEDLEAMVEAGATRIGASSGVAIMNGLKSDSNY